MLHKTEWLDAFTTKANRLEVDENVQAAGVWRVQHGGQDCDELAVAGPSRRANAHHEGLVVQCRASASAAETCASSLGCRGTVLSCTALQRISIIIIIIRQFIRCRNMSVKSLQGRRTENTLGLLVLSYTMYDCRNSWVLRRFSKVDNVDAVRMSDGRLFYTAGPETQNARLPRRRHSSGK